MPFKTKKAAAERGEEVRQLMRDPDLWRVRAHTNMGGHWSLLGGPVMVTESKVSGFYAMVADYEGHVGSGAGFWTAPGTPTFKTPQAAVDAAVAYARSFVDRVTEVCEAAERLTTQQSGTQPGKRGVDVDPRDAEEIIASVENENQPTRVNVNEPQTPQQDDGRKHGRTE